ncbi:hypothetical protein K2X83_03070, partial [Patescibacteria group bacterium]|nr:hypothetical protein [Patescibacteria group bacterium]
APQPEIDLSVTPAGVRRGESCTLSVGARHVSSCTVTGTGINEQLTVNAEGMVPTRSIRTPGIESTTTYTVSCTSPRGTISKSAQCVYLPVFREQ